LLSLMRADPLLAALTGLLAIGAWLPLAFTPILPFADLPNNAGAASLILPSLFGHGVPAHHYQVNLQPLPYWSAYALMAVLAAMGGALFAAKAITALLVLLLPLATMRLLAALGRNPRMGLFAFILAYEHNLYGGWVTYLLGMSLALIALAWMLEAKTWRDALRVVPLTLVIGLTHIQAVWLLSAAAVALTVTGRPFLRRVWLHGLAWSGCLIVIAPWLLRLLSGAASSGPSRIGFEYPPTGEKLASFYKFTLANLDSPSGGTATSLAFVVLLLAPLMLSQLPRLQGSSANRGGGAVLLLVCLGLYAVLPMTVTGPIPHWYTYPRYATFVVLSLLLIPRPRLDGVYAWALAPGVIAALVMDYSVARQFAELATRSRPFLEIIAAIRPNASILPLQYDERDNHPRWEVYSQMSAYAAGEKRGYEPNMFDNPTNPLLYRHAHDLPHPGWWNPDGFSMEKHGRFWDYILVQGKTHDPVRPGVRTSSGHHARQVAEAGRWRLYEVVK
jgi:hypothetical protein